MQSVSDASEGRAVCQAIVSRTFLSFGGGQERRSGGCAACALLLAVTACAGCRADAQVWVTTANRSRLLAREADLNSVSQAPLENVIDVDPARRYQAMVGFGAAVTDSSAWLISTKLNAKQRAALLQELFGRDRADSA